ncbi:alanine/glycine:cation symporter family protein [Bartonella sp. DGB1]|uniref:alanine/glycine:cation symporter family protein n=1 Tax=Bartonella sp. DGB1 TaxID=3239807 RepID=UPI003524BED2
MTGIIDFVNYYLWGYVLIFGLILTGAYFTLRLRFIQIVHFGEFLRLAFKPARKGGKRQGITPFQALMVSLASRVGVGNITGVAVALYLGGAGAIFWMWVVAFLGIATAYAENALGQLYKVRNEEGQFRGGPSFYIARGLKAPLLAKIFACCLILSYGLVFNAVQANSIADSINFAFGVPKSVMGVILAILVGIVILGGINKVAKVAQYLVPSMALFYFLVVLYIVLTNITEVPAAFKMIFYSAFGFEQAAGGFTGGLMAAMLNGVKRGLFSNEAGAGSSPNIAAVADPTPPHPATQGFIQALGAALDTLVVCTATALLILLSGQLDFGSTVTGMELTQRAMHTYFGDLGVYFVALIIFFFAFTSILGNYSYAENAMVYLKVGSRKYLYILCAVLLIMVMWGSVQTVQMVFNAADASMGIMATINIIAILVLSNVVVKMTKDYFNQKNMGKIPEFNLSEYPELKGQIEEDIWGKEQMDRQREEDKK